MERKGEERTTAVATFVIYDRRYSSLSPPPSGAHPMKGALSTRFPFDPLNTFASSRSNFGFPGTRREGLCTREMRSGDVVTIIGRDDNTEIKGVVTVGLYRYHSLPPLRIAAYKSRDRLGCDPSSSPFIFQSLLFLSLSLCLFFGKMIER